MSVAAGQQAPSFEIETTDGPLTLDALLERGPLVLLFYAEDATPLCTAQVCGFRDEDDTLRALGASVLAVSVDPLESHVRFADREGGFPFPLAADPDLELAAAYGVVDDAGKRSRRAVFVIGSDGVVVKANPGYQPQVMEQFAAVFRALGLEM